MMSPEIIKATQTLICQDFELPNITLNQEDQLQQLREWLAHAIEQMLARNPERLVQLFYRLDVKESKFQKAFLNQTELAPPLALADLVIEREMQKVHTRAWYKAQQQEQARKVDEEDEDWL